MRASWAETVEGHADPALRPRVYEGTPEDVHRFCVRATEELDGVLLAEADVRRGTVSGWVRLLPLAALPVLGPPKHPREGGKGWFHRFDPALAQGWLQVRVEPAGKEGVRVRAHLRLEVPFAGPLAAALLKGYLRWLDVRRGEPVRP